MSNSNYILGLDLGTKKIAALLGRSQDGHLSLCGLGLAPSDGIRRGQVVDLEKATLAIGQALSNLKPIAKDAAKSGVAQVPPAADAKLPQRAWVGITGNHIRCFNPHADIAITKPGRAITSRDVEEVMRAAVSSIALPSGHEVIHVIARSFSIHLRETEGSAASPIGPTQIKPARPINTRGASPLSDETFRNSITNPVGMPASRLEVNAHVISAATVALGQLEQCLERAGLMVDGVVLQPLASADAVLTEAERELGVALLDIGAGTTDIAMFADGAICYTGSLALGGNHITRDLSVGLEVEPEEAEKLKIASGSALLDAVDLDARVNLRPLSSETTRQVPKTLLAEIIQPRAAEILSLAKDQMLRSGFFHRMAAGVIITGGGSQLHDLLPLAKHVLGLPVRLGRPFAKGPATFKDPSLATGVGLLLYGSQEQLHTPPVSWPPAKQSLAQRFIAWCRHIFGP